MSFLLQLRKTLTSLTKVSYARTGSVDTVLEFVRDLSSNSVEFQDGAVYRNKAITKQFAIERVYTYAATSGIDAGGADSASIAGAFHISGGGSAPDKFKHLTVTFKDKRKQQMYFYRVEDKTFWERIHIPEKDSDLPQPYTYRVISREAYINHIAPDGV